MDNLPPFIGSLTRRLGLDEHNERNPSCLPQDDDDLKRELIPNYVREPAQRRGAAQAQWRVRRENAPL